MAELSGGEPHSPKGIQKGLKQDSACSVPAGSVPTNHVVGKTCCRGPGYSSAPCRGGSMTRKEAR